MCSQIKTSSSLFVSLWLLFLFISTPPALSNSLTQNTYKYQDTVEAQLKIAQDQIKRGQFRLAMVKLNQLKQIPNSNPHFQALIQTTIGNAQTGLGQYQQALSTYKESLTQVNSVSTLNNLVAILQKLKKSSLLQAKEAYTPEDAQKNDDLAQKYQSQALKYAQEAVTISSEQISLSAVRSLIEWQKFPQNRLNQKQLARGRAILAQLPPSRSLGFLMLNWAAIDVEQTAWWLKEAKALAQTLGDRSLTSDVFLELGHFYQRTGKLNQALASARASQAFSSSKLKLSNISLYRSQWLAGQIAHQLGNQKMAIKNYQNAIATIDLISQNLEPAKGEQISQFNQEIQPVYREALELILNQPEINTTQLQQSLIIADKLRLSQLRNYFGDNCLELSSPTAKNFRKNNAQAASIHSIILKDKTVFLLQLPNGQIKKSEAKIKASQLNNQARQWYQKLTTGYTWEFLTGSRFFYNLIIQPFEAELEQANLSTLIFIHDGILRNLPMAALNNDQEFLIERWAIISSVGLKSTSPLSEALKSEKSEALVFGLSQPQQPEWSSLEMIPVEVNQVNKSLDGRKFLNQDFTVNNLKQQLVENKYSVVHLATHGYFGGSAKNSFILAYDHKISVLEMEDILTFARENPDLLVLSACQTAINSDLAFLGLAGVAAKSGITSTLGSLWQVDDQSQSEVIDSFYSQLQNNLDNQTSKSSQSYALILQKIQIEQIRSLVHPRTWAALSLIGN